MNNIKIIIYGVIIIQSDVEREFRSDVHATWQRRDESRFLITTSRFLLFSIVVVSRRRDDDTCGSARRVMRQCDNRLDSETVVTVCTLCETGNRDDQDVIIRERSAVVGTCSGEF